MPLAAGDVWEEVYTNMHDAYDAMRAMARITNATAEEIAAKLGDDVADVQNVLHGRQMLTFETLSRYATAMGCRLKVEFVPYENVK